ncbi:MAG: periplasmic binding protein [Planctomycetaceae bacterium]|nr:periplasmic binding protein [Planctomycetaceae bacterium]
MGRSHECDYPPSILGLPQCSRPRIDVTGSSRDIDERVKSSASQGLSLYDVDGPRLRELAPDVILTQTQCEVCAVSLKDVEAAVCGMLGVAARLVSLHPNSLADLWRDIRLVASELGVAERGETLVGRLADRLSRLQAATLVLNSRPRVACLEWLDPLMAAGNWVPELVDIAGGENLFGTAGLHSPWMDWDDLIAADPEVIVALPCGWDIAKASLELAPLVSRPGWSEMQAVRSGRVYVTDGNQYFNRPGPRLVESAEILAEMFHPGKFDFGHAGIAWKVFPEVLS